MAVSVNGRVGGGSTAAGLSAVQEAIKAQRFADLAELLDTLELETAATGTGIPQDWPYTIHLLAHVVVGDLNSARFLWKRIPAPVKQNNLELIAAWKIVKCLWAHGHAAVHEALRSYSWSPEVQQVISAVAENYSQKMLKLLYTAYSTISVSDAAGCLGMTEQEVVSYTMQHGWTLDPVAKMLTVSPNVSSVEQKTDASQLQSLTEYVFHLEH
ncbi:COP9 signalosome complex subunit 8 [Marchantia polymorpha subsp. ruderalis]|uniref:CSN8/PSMD8/EIF3K domain-containing protein n=2 Tax=Marchantia polymorpha TaxID=3197 RepID=A0A176VXY0_MARPO|nr:hypothetical protein AXG93_48s1030 [Marchantia polymorpha subsp. ruderalis]PTQ41114.1 hypothetical protein MARPO_0036s0096 [Marchantia polymorpha]BBM97811.1 hypothetical protein Mp_1g08530 [Marchantia polymorpha subsp. ruderalis]|eukprot:PTQ41114.1 hypothetical protein MARPO_0036s0096 [Marchantia polymorpha]